MISPEANINLMGAHAALEPKAVANGRMILRSAMEYGFVGPLDIGVEQFPPDLAQTARLMKDAIENGNPGFEGTYLHIVETMEPGITRDFARANFLDVSQEMLLPPEALEKCAATVKDYHLAKLRTQAAWKLQKILAAGEDATEVLGEIQCLTRETAATGLSAQLAARAFDFHEPPEKPVPIFSLRHCPLCTEGNITNIQALPKAGKSAVVEALIASTLAGRVHGPDTLGFLAENVHGKALIHFDTEQSRFDHDALNRRAMRRAGVVEKPEWLRSYTVADAGVAERLKFLRLAMETAEDQDGGVFAVLIDGIGDLCSDPNDSEEAFALVAELHRLAIRHECTIVTVLHENPGSESGKTRGHLGSQLERKSETNLRLAKDKDGITTIWAERARHCYLPKAQGPCFAWNREKEMHTSCGTAGEIKQAADRDKMEEEVSKCFDGDEPMKYSQLLITLMDRADVKERAAKGRVSKWAAEGLIRKDANGLYRLV